MLAGLGDLVAPLAIAAVGLARVVPSRALSGDSDWLLAALVLLTSRQPVQRAWDDAAAEQLDQRAEAEGYSETALNHTNLHMEHGESQEAERLYRQALSRGDTDAHNNLGVLLEETQPYQRP